MFSVQIVLKIRSIVDKQLLGAKWSLTLGKDRLLILGKVTHGVADLDGLGIWSVRVGMMRMIGHRACRNVEVAGEKCVGRGQEDLEIV